MDPLAFDLEAPTPPACGVTRLTLRRLFVGELPADQRSTVETHTKDCLDCQAVLAELRSDDAAFKVHIPFGRFVADHEKRAAKAAPVTSVMNAAYKWLFGGGAVAALAVGAAVMLLAPNTSLQDPTLELGNRIKGGGIGFLLKTQQGVRAGKAGEELQAGDQIQFYVKGPSQEAELVVVGVDGKGAVTVYHAGPSPTGPTGKASPLQDSVVLDDALGPERFFAVYGTGVKAEVLREAAQKAAEKLVAQGADLKTVETLPLELPQAIQSSVWIVKINHR